MAIAAARGRTASAPQLRPGPGLRRDPSAPTTAGHHPILDSRTVIFRMSKIRRRTATAPITADGAPQPAQAPGSWLTASSRTATLPQRASLASGLTIQLALVPTEQGLPVALANAWTHGGA